MNAEDLWRVLASVSPVIQSGYHVQHDDDHRNFRVAAAASAGDCKAGDQRGEAAGSGQRVEGREGIIVAAWRFVTYVSIAIFFKTSLRNISVISYIYLYLYVLNGHL